MANFLAEVDEALKRERAEKLWKDYGGVIVGTILLIILGTAGISGYRVWDKGAKTTQTEKFLEAAEARNPETLIEVAESLRPGLKTLALWRAAGAFLDQGKQAEALKIYRDILANTETPTDLKHLAAFQIARLTARENPEAGLALLEKSANDINNPWAILARLDVAVLQARHKKNFQIARDHLSIILQETDLPVSVERKARSLDSLYAIEAPETTKAQKAPTVQSSENEDTQSNTSQTESKDAKQNEKGGAQ
ncbi:MAG: tetratricopeptide repeat protein [Alphaproteobacteria bacterium]|nr:tetratricopeptide repeat protein [Alphaproteobacteria bacterium]